MCRVRVEGKLAKAVMSEGMVAAVVVALEVAEEATAALETAAAAVGAAATETADWRVDPGPRVEAGGFLVAEAAEASRARVEGEMVDSVGATGRP